jgi:hypothetical protein
MIRHAVINKDNVVVNVILWNRRAKWSPPEGHYLVQDDKVNIGDYYHKDKNKFTPFEVVKAGLGQGGTGGTEG